jgi:hypothetical protein
MEPREIIEYQYGWINKNICAAVETDSDDYNDAQRWCRDNLKVGSWKGTKYSSPYESSFVFENETDRKTFENIFTMKGQR